MNKMMDWNKFGPQSILLGPQGMNSLHIFKVLKKIE